MKFLKFIFSEKTLSILLILSLFLAPTAPIFAQESVIVNSEPDSVQIVNESTPSEEVVIEPSSVENSSEGVSEPVEENSQFGEPEGQTEPSPLINPPENFSNDKRDLPKIDLPQVDKASGGLSYEYNIKVPPGRNDFYPKISLKYNSQENDNQNIFGYGWTVDIPYIKRLNKTGVDKLYLDNYFYSSLSGELVLVSGNIYAPKVENGMFLTYEYDGTFWTIKDKNGTVYKFGENVESRQDNSDHSKTFKWMLEDQRDLNNNYIKYEYYKDSGQIYPNLIKYTGNDNYDGDFNVSFLRETRADNVLQNNAAFDITTNYRISEIKLNFNNDWVRKYDLNYLPSENSERSLLSNIIEFGKDDNLNILELPPVEFSYQTTNTPGSDFVSDSNWGTGASPTLNTNPNFGTLVADVNNDGLPDLLESWQNQDHWFRGTYINNGDGTWNEDENLEPPFPFAGESPIHEYGIRASDINGDGLTDIIQSYNTGPGQSNTIQRVYINTGTSWYLDTNWDPKCFFWSWPLGDTGCRLADVNGDNLADFIQATGDTNWNPPIETRVYLNNGNGWNSNDSTWSIPLDLRPGVVLVDYNGDGLLDFLKGYKNPTSNPIVEIKQAYKNNGNKTWSLDPSYEPPVFFAVQSSQSTLPTGTNIQILDINGDGLVDILKGTETQSGVHLNTGSGWYFSTIWDFGYGSIPQYTPSPIRFADFDGDGMIDQYDSANGSATLSRNQKKRADLMNVIENQYGGIANVEYKATPKYVNTNGGLLNPDLPFLMMTVYQTTTNPGFSNPNIINTYSYEGGDYYFNNNLDKRFSGFNKVSVNDSLNKTNTYFHQGNTTDSSNGEYDDHSSKIGKPYRIDMADSSGNIYESTINKWDRYNQGTDRDFVKLLRVTNITKDGNSDHKDKAEEYVYEDTYGNLTQKTSYGEVNANNDGTFTDTGNDKYTEEIVYAINTNEYIVGLPSHNVITDQSSNKIRESKTYYDNEVLGEVTEGNITKIERWKDGENYVNTQKSYNEFGLPITSTDERGKVTTYTYDSYNLYPATVTGPLDFSTNYLYDYSSGKVKETFTPDYLTYQTTYDGLDRILEEKVPDLEFPFTPVVKTSYLYNDIQGAVSVARVDHLGAYNQVDSYQYFDGLNRLIQERREMEGWNEFAAKDIVYNSINLVQKESLPYMSNGTARTPATSVNNLYKNYTYDPVHRIATVIDSVGTTSYGYNDWKTTITDPNGNPKHYYKDSYDNLIRVDEINDTETYSTYYEWDGNKNLTKITDALNNVRNFTYDGLNRRLTAEDLHAVSDNTFGVWEYAYDNAGNLIQTVNPNNQIVNYTYNDINQMLTEDFAGEPGIEVNYFYNECLNGVYLLCKIETIDDIDLNYTYASNKKVFSEFKELDGLNLKISYEYDRQGNLIEISNSDKSNIKYDYDSAGQVNSIKRKERSDSSYTDIIQNIDYGPNGKASQIEYYNGLRTRYWYDVDEMYRLKKISTTNPNNISYGPPVTAYFYSNRYGDGNIEKYNTDWDVAHDSDTGSPNPSSSISYVRTGKHADNYYVTRGILPFDTSTLPREANVIDANLRIYVNGKRSVDNDGNDFITVVKTTQQNVNEINPEDFNEFGNTNNPIEGINISERKDISNISEYSYLTFNLNEVGRSWVDKAYYTQLGLREGHDVLDDLPHSPDNETDFNEIEFRTANYSGETYDPRLEVTYTLPVPAVLQDINYTYDNVGNIIQVTEDANTDTDKEVSYTYDDLNRLTQAVATNVAQGQSPYTYNYTYNAVGNITEGPLGTYSYDGTSYKNPHAVSEINSIDFTYDNNGNLLEKGEDQYTWNYKNQLIQSTTGEDVNEYTYDYKGDRLKTSKDNYNTYFISKYYQLDSNNKVTRNVYLGDQLVAMLEVENGVVTPYYTHTDHLNSINLITNDEAQVVNLIDYYPYGEKRINEGTYNSQKEYIGQVYDEDTQMSYLNSRYYQGSRGQFVSQDPVFLNPEGSGLAVFNTFLTDPQTQNSYSYARNNPITLSDPDGKFIPVVVGAIYAAAPAIIAGIETAATALAAGFIAHDVGTIAGTAMSNAPASYKNEVYNGVAENWGAGLSVASQLSPMVAGEARTATRTTLQANKAAGAAFESKVFSGYKSLFPETQSQVTAVTESGVKTRFDIVIPKANGSFCLIECKSSATAPLTKNQSLAFPEIQRSGATVVGNGKTGIPGGTVIPPTKVNIVRP